MHGVVVIKDTLQINKKEFVKKHSQVNKSE